ncbi:MAG: DUF3168 domain-containing protein [Gemmatales bacterium]|nr:DUF3168 domain-containing protein [Gemmatales bacterium]MDW8175127.1 DUF3168 domain-containing protein [Gemmatales bacterium]
MQPEQIIRDLLANSSAVQQAVGNRIYTGMVPAGAIMPCISVQTQGGEPIASLDQPALAYKTRVAVIVIGSRQEVASIYEQAVRIVLESSDAVNQGIVPVEGFRLELEDMGRDLCSCVSTYDVWHA